jgi:hypothetical protein
MEGFWANFGFFAAVCIIILGYNKFLDYREMNRPYHQTDERVYEAADAFLLGATSQQVAAMLQSCLDIGDSQADSILKTAMSHKADRDGGYRTFIQTVNREIGEDVYSTRRRVKSHTWKVGV